MQHIFSEHRLIYRNASDYNVTATNSRAVQRQRKAQDEANKKRNDERLVRQAVWGMEANRYNPQTGERYSGSNFGNRTDLRARDKAIIGDLTKRGLKITDISAQKKREAQRQTALSQAEIRYANWYNAQIEKNGYVDPVEAQIKREEVNAEVESLYGEFATRDEANIDRAKARKEKRAGVQGVQETKLTTGGINAKTRPGTTMQQRSDERGLLRTQRLGLEPKTPGGAPKATPGGAGQAPKQDIPTKAFPTYTDKQRAAAGALSGDDLEAPTSLTGIVDEEMTAIAPELEAQANIRDSFKIYQKGAQKLLDERGEQIEKYKNDGIDRAEKIADMKIAQSKENRDLELELIEDARERSRRDELLTQEQIETQYDREEDRIIAENVGRIERLQTSLGARYGGFGSGKGLAKIQAARDEGSEVLRQLNEDRIYSRRESQNKLDDIEADWKNDRRIVFNEHEQAITAAYTEAMQAAQGIDDKALDEEGEKIDASIGLLKETFDAMEKIWTKTGEALSGANKRALERRDTLRKETYDKQQDAFKNIFSALSVLPSNSPFFSRLEKQAGLSPGTIASTKSFEERRMAISEANLRISQRQLQLQLDEFERDGNQIDTDASKLLGRIVTSTGETFRDPLGNPVYLVGEGGSITSSVTNDARLYGSAAVGMGSTVNFSQYALTLGDIVPGSSFHKGGEYDIDNVAGTPIQALTGGTVTAVGNDPNGYGIYVDVYDGINTTRYAHLQRATVKVGDQISGFSGGNGQILGLMGNTGNAMGLDGHRPTAGDMQTGSHLHLEIRSGADWNAGQIIDPMDVGMVPGMMHSGRVVWVDDMRKKLKQGAPIGTSAKGGTFGSELDTPWIEIDQQILELAKDVFRDPDGKTDWQAVDIVFDYLQQNKMGDYNVSYTGKGAVEGSYQASKEISYGQQVHGRSNVTADREMIRAGFVDPEDFYDSLMDGTLSEMSDAQAASYLYDMGYIVEEGRLWGVSVREMTKDEIAVLNQKRSAMGLPQLK